MTYALAVLAAFTLPMLAPAAIWYALVILWRLRLWVAAAAWVWYAGCLF